MSQSVNGVFNINGKIYAIPKDPYFMTYEDIAYFTDRHPARKPTITWCLGEHNSCGVLPPGGELRIYDGMVINCMITGNS